MSYSKTIWATGDVITASKMNNIEDQLESLTPPVESISSNVANEYSSSSLYDVDDYVLYDNLLYKCTAAILTPEEWDDAHWEQVNLAAELQQAKTTTLDNRNNQAIETISTPTPLMIMEDAAPNKLKSIDIDLPVQQEGTGDPSPTNVRAITPHTSVTLTRTNKNMANIIHNATLPYTPVAVLDFGRDVTLAYLRVSLFCTDAVYSNNTGSVSDLRKADGTHQYQTGGAYGLKNNVTNNGIFRYSAKNVTLQKVVMQNNCSWQSGTISVQVEYAGLGTAEYEKHQSETITYTLPTELEGVYGGNLHINDDGSGVLTVTHRKEVFNGNSTITNMVYRDGYPGVYSSQLTAYPAAGALTLVTDYLPTKHIYGLSELGFYTYNNGANIGMRLSSDMLSGYGTVTDAVSGNTAIKAYLTDHPLTVVYQLATPLTYSLTNQQVVSLLENYNALYTTSGDINKVEYIRSISSIFTELATMREDEITIEYATVNWVQGYLNTSTGENIDTYPTVRIRTENYIDISHGIYLDFAKGVAGGIIVNAYDKNYGFINAIINRSSLPDISVMSQSNQDILQLAPQTKYIRIAMTKYPEATFSASEGHERVHILKGLSAAAYCQLESKLNEYTNIYVENNDLIIPTKL